MSVTCKSEFVCVWAYVMLLHQYVYANILCKYIMLICRSQLNYHSRLFILFFLLSCHRWSAKSCILPLENKLIDVLMDKYVTSQ